MKRDSEPGVTQAVAERPSGRLPSPNLAGHKRPNWTPEEAREMGRRGAEARAAKRKAERKELQSLRTQARTRGEDGAFYRSGPDFVLDQAWHALAVQIRRLATAAGPKPTSAKEATELIKQLLDTIGTLEQLASKHTEASRGPEPIGANAAVLLRSMLSARLDRDTVDTAG